MSKDGKDIDLEAAAIQQLAVALSPLDEQARERVIDWAKRRYGSAVASVAASDRVSEHVAAQRPVTAAAPAAGAKGFETFADLYDAVGPETDTDKALVGGYWLQVCVGNDSFPSRDVNELLKQHGQPVGNITRAFDNLRNAKPTSIQQIEKSGKTKQARKKLKVTTHGIRYIQAKIPRDGA